MTRSIEASIADLAVRQHGLVTRAQLLDTGLGPDAVKHRLRSQRLRPVQRGVYRLGPLVSPHEREMAAVLACGGAAVVSHRSAASLWRILPRRDASAPVEVTVRSRHRRRRPGVRVYCLLSLAPDEVTSVDRIPVTAPARTVLDLAGVAPTRTLERALARAEREGRATPADVRSLIRRHPRGPGIAVLRALLERDAGPAMTRSDAEERFLELIDRADLMRPESNVDLLGHEVDFLWRAERLVVQVDGFAFHSSRRRFEEDRRRDGWLAADGFRVMRVTWRQIVDGPEAMLVRLAGALAVGGPRATASPPAAKLRESA